MGCPQTGVMGVHTDAYYDGEACGWCGATHMCEDFSEAHCVECGAEQNPFGGKKVVDFLTD